MKQAIVLAGGKGTRLADRLGELPKPLIDICGMPLLERQVLLLKQHGFEQILVLVNHRAEVIEKFCMDRANWGLDVQCIDDGEPRGTAGAVLAILDRLEAEFLIMYGDTMLQVDLGRFEAWHKATPNAAATLFLHPNDHPQDSDLVELDADGYIREFHPYPHPEGAWLPNLVNAALYCVRRDALRPWRNVDVMLDFGKDLFPAMLQSGLRLRGYSSPEYIKDVGTPERIDKVSSDFISGRITRASLGHPQMAVFLDRDGTINREVDHLCHQEQFELLPGTAQAIRRLNESEFRVCVITNQPVIARGNCSESELNCIHNKMVTLLGQAGAYIDRIDYCPHHPDYGFPGEISALKIICDCRKPGTGMIDSAVSALNIDRKQSWLIGDASGDILTANRAGLRSILVETGYAGLDHRHFASPDYVSATLSDAVDFILDGHPRLLKAVAPLAEVILAESLIFVGGHSRSGKSTFASALREVLQMAGRNCHILSTDRWLLSDESRGPGVSGRHDMDALHALIARLAKRDTVIEELLPVYVKQRRQQIPAVQSLRIELGDYVIIEGVVALALADGAPNATRIAVKCDEQQRRARILHEYKLRGEGKLAEQLYAQRMQDEWPLIEATSAGAMHFNMVQLNLVERN